MSEGVGLPVPTGGLVGPIHSAPAECWARDHVTPCPQTSLWKLGTATPSGCPPPKLSFWRDSGLCFSVKTFYNIPPSSNVLTWAHHKLKGNYIRVAFHISLSWLSSQVGTCLCPLALYLLAAFSSFCVNMPENGEFLSAIFLEHSSCCAIRRCSALSVFWGSDAQNLTLCALYLGLLLAGRPRSSYLTSV